MRFAELPGWKDTDARAALEAFRRSCSVLAKAATRTLGRDGYAGMAQDWRPVCANVPDSARDIAAARGFFESAFSALEIRQSNGASALFTGYYEPELSASLTRAARYQTPIYGVPLSWASANLGAFHRDLEGGHIEGCVHEHRFAPCAARAEIDANGMPDAPILFYSDDPVSVFFLHIQGSGRALIDDGSMVRLAYAGQNGQPYTPIGRVLIRKGFLDRDHMSMQAIRTWLRANPRVAQNIMESDKSYVFFREQSIGDPGLGSPGTEGVPLTPRASLAVDARWHPLGVPFYVATSRPDADPRLSDKPFRQLLIAQDTGGAIRGPMRADIFWGFGSDAESIAGRMKARGRIFVLIPKKVAPRLRTPLRLHE
ncbi:MAG TPA: MltA domain-containing protein [Rhizomicrobium sp.]|nr:MltA domain-containing protein [Rhizomicrobium sp.]